MDGLRTRLARLGSGLLRFARDEDGTSDVEYVLLLTFVVPLIMFPIPPVLMNANFRYFNLIQIWINMPFP